MSKLKFMALSVAFAAIICSYFLTNTSVRSHATANPANSDLDYIFVEPNNSTQDDDIQRNKPSKKDIEKLKRRVPKTMADLLNLTDDLNLGFMAEQFPEKPSNDMPRDYERNPLINPRKLNEKQNDTHSGNIFFDSQKQDIYLLKRILPDNNFSEPDIKRMPFYPKSTKIIKKDENHLTINNYYNFNLNLSKYENEKEFQICPYPETDNAIVK